ncbi:MAG: carbohydrate porin [Gemmataceae bacterium]
MRSLRLYRQASRWRLAILAAGVGAVAAAEPPVVPLAAETGHRPAVESTVADPFGGLPADRPKLTGDWLGVRTNLRDRGITVDVSSTQFYQGVTTGGLDRSFVYGGRNDYLVTLDGGKLGLWGGAFVTLHGETRYGVSPSLATGALLPVNLQLALPAETGTVTALTAVVVSQYLTDNLVVYAGKYNTIDGYPQPLTGANRDTGFLNTALSFNPIDYRTVPFVTYGAGVTYQAKDDPLPLFLFEVLDTNDTPTTAGFDTFFDNGVTLFTQVNVPTRLFGKPGHQGVSGAYSSGRYTNLSPASYYNPLTGLVFPSPLKQGAWFVGYNFDQAVWADPDDPKRVWGVFGSLGLADDNPSPIRWFSGGGIAGTSPLPGRRADTFGLAYWRAGIGDPLKRTARPVTPLRDEQGVEVYYNARVTPWFQLTPDVQVVVPIQQRADAALLIGLRARVDF